ncbi:MAG: hypothetical protein AB2598_06085 [Candidatus Thiodiazotropha sp.]
MSIYGHLIKSISYPLIAKVDGVIDLRKELDVLKRNEYKSKEQIRAIQLEKLKHILTHAYENCDFYRQRFDSVNFSPAEFSSFEQLNKIPPLTKTDLQTNLSTLIASNYPENQIHKDATGGSTGNHTPFYRDNLSLQIKRGYEFRFNNWAGWDIGEKIAFYWPAIQDLAGRHKSWKERLRNQLSDRSLVLFSGNQNEQILEQHYKQLTSFKPTLMRTFPNPLANFAKFLKETGKTNIHIPSIISVGEPLLDSQRVLFEEVLGSKVYNCYVSRECGNMACECGSNPGDLHVNAEMIYIEPLDSVDAQSQQPVKFLLTDLTNHGMPFIRYQIEDLGIFLDHDCGCGRGLPLIRMEAGRASDFLISPFDKSRVSGCSLLHHLIAEGPNVGQIQLIQDKLDHLTIKLVKGENFDDRLLDHFNNVLNNVFKNKMHYTIDYVSEIEREKSNKYFFTKCLISKDE